MGLLSDLLMHACILSNTTSRRAQVKSSGGPKLSKAKIAAALKEQEEGYLTLDEVKAQIDASITNAEGEYLSVGKMQELLSEAGYLSIAEMQALNP
jgi:hypothetical protein